MQHHAVRCLFHAHVAAEALQPPLAADDVGGLAAEEDGGAYLAVGGIPLRHFVAHHHVRALGLGKDVLLAVQQVLGDVLEDLRLGVTARLDVAPQLPAEEKLRLGVEEDGQVVHLPEVVRGEAQETAHDHHLVRLHDALGPKGAVAVVVRAVADGAPAAEERQVLPHQPKVVHGGVERGEPHLLALGPGEAVVVVQLQGGDALRPQQLADPLRHRVLAAPGIAADPHDEGARRRIRRCAVRHGRAPGALSARMPGHGMDLVLGWGDRRYRIATEGGTGNGERGTGVNRRLARFVPERLLR